MELSSWQTYFDRFGRYIEDKKFDKSREAVCDLNEIDDLYSLLYNANIVVWFIEKGI